MRFKITLKVICFTSAIAIVQPSYGCKVDISDYVGWTIIYSGTVTGYITESGQEEDSFEGCEYGRILIVDHTKMVTCMSYSYSYAYYPDIVVLSNGSRKEACIDDDMYDVD